MDNTTKTGYSLDYDKYAIARQMYIDNEVSIAQVAKATKINRNTLHQVKKREKWDILKQAQMNEILEARNQMIYDIKVRGIEFYSNILEKCNEMSSKKIYDPRIIKTLVECHKMAFDQMLLVGNAPLGQKHENKAKEIGQGLLDLLGKI